MPASRLSGGSQRQAASRMPYPSQMQRLILAAWLLAAPVAAQIVEGRVLDSTTGLGIPDAFVSLFQAGQDGYSATSDAQGRFRIEGVKEGSYVALYNARNFTHDRDAFSVPVKVTAASELLKLELKMVPAGSISGRVLDAAGKPVPKAMVQLQTLESGGMAVQIASDENGAYGTAPMLLPGTWIVSATAPPALKPPESPPDQRLGWAQTFYPSATDRQLAAQVTIQPGSELSKIDIRLAAVPVHRIRGLVLDERGDPAPKIPVALGQLGNNFPWPVEPITRQGDPTFEFESVGGGEWILSTLAVKDGVPLWASQPVQVKDHDVEEVQVRLTAPFSIQGKIVLETIDGQPTPKPPAVRIVNATVFAATFRPPVVQALSLPGNGFYNGEPDEKGRFTINDLYQGPYHIIPELAPAGYYLDSIRLGDGDALDFGVPILSGAPPLVVTYRLNGGSVRGTVDGCGAGKVLLIPQTAILRRDGFIRQANCGGKGRFEIIDIRPGEYYGFAVAPEDPAGLPGGASQLDQSLMNQSIRVSVRSNESTLSDVHLIAR